MTTLFPGQVAPLWDAMTMDDSNMQLNPNPLNLPNPLALDTNNINLDAFHYHFSPSPSASFSFSPTSSLDFNFSPPATFSWNVDAQQKAPQPPLPASLPPLPLIPLPAMATLPVFPPPNVFPPLDINFTPAATNKNLNLTVNFPSGSNKQSPKTRNSKNDGNTGNGNGAKTKNERIKRVGNMPANNVNSMDRKLFDEVGELQCQFATLQTRYMNDEQIFAEIELKLNTEIEKLTHRYQSELSAQCHQKPMVAVDQQVDELVDLNAKIKAMAAKAGKKKWHQDVNEIYRVMHENNSLLDAINKISAKIDSSQQMTSESVYGESQENVSDNNIRICEVAMAEALRIKQENEDELLQLREELDKLRALKK
mmetsp:Transcript_55872/g.88908  ORF Transcript_55872/g.88908 Transcript_55872/m.88908 type:complete len:367 (+) Transcript_55872:78-1178(+)